MELPTNVMTRPDHVRPDPNAYRHMRTRNQSFLKTYNELRRKGIRNCDFFLRLYDPSLADVDPRSPNLSAEVKGRISIEVWRNPWYYLREVIRIPVDGGFAQFQLHRGNLALSTCILDNRNSLTEIPRQNYKTTSALCVYAWVYDFATENSQLSFGNKRAPDAIRNLSTLKGIRNQSPHWLTMRDLKAETDNAESIIQPRNNNRIVTLSNANDANSADKLGRGMTTATLYWDEWAFVKHNKEIYTSAAPATSKAAENAMANGSPYGKTFTTTPSYLDDPAGEFCRGMMDQACPWDDEFYDLTREELDEILLTSSKNNFLYLRFSYRDCGRDDRWLEAQTRELNNDLKAVKRELLLEWTYAVDSSPFTEEELTAISDLLPKESRSPVKLDLRSAGDRLWSAREWIDLIELPWIFGVDVSGGLGEDASAMVGLHPRTLEPYFEYKNPNIDVPSFEEFIKKVARFFPNAVFVIERNSYGLVIIQNILKNDQALRRRLYRAEVGSNGTSKEVRMRERKAEDEGGKKMRYGVDTSTKTRPIMYEDILSTVVRESPEQLASEYLFGDLKTLERKRNGKIEARSGRHDDVLMACLVARYALVEDGGKGLRSIMRWPQGAREPGDRGRDASSAQGFGQRFLFNVNRPELSPIGEDLYRQGTESAGNNKSRMIKRLFNMGE